MADEGTEVKREIEVSSTEVQNSFGEYLNRAGFRGERFSISRHGKVLGALIGPEDLERLRQLDGEVAA